MKKSFGITAIVAVCITLFSFSTVEARKADYNIINKSNANKVATFGSFSSYENGHYTSDKGTWNTRKQTWSATALSLESVESSLNAVEKALD